MRLLFALLLIIAGSVAMQSANRNKLDGFRVLSSAGNVSPKYKMTERDQLASNKAVQHAEYHRRFIHTGVGNVPPLDPFTQKVLKSIHFDGKHTALNGTLQLSDLVVTGASAFSIKSMEVYLKTHRMDFHLTVPEIKTRVHYSAINFMYNGLRFNTSGDVEILFNDYRVQGAVSIVANPSTGHYMVNGLDVVVSVANGWYTTSSPIGKPTEKDIADSRVAIFEAITSGVAEELTHVLSHYSVPQVDTFMEP